MLKHKTHRSFEDIQRRAYRLNHSVEPIFAVGGVIDFSYAAIRLNDYETDREVSNSSRQARREMFS